MDIQYRKLTMEDLETFIAMRISQLREEGAREERDLGPALKDYYVRHMADGTFVSWLALDEGRIIGTSGMSFVEKPPYFGCPSGRNAGATDNRILQCGIFWPVRSGIYRGPARRARRTR